MNPELSQKLSPELRQTLELALSPRLLQMLKVLSLPYIELVEKIDKEAEENVMLEVERKDELFEFIKYINSDKKIRKEGDFSDLPGLENLSDTSKTLEATLLEQLRLENLSEIHLKIGQMLIGSIDERGYLTNYPDVRDEIMKELDVSRPTVDKVLKVVQTFEPDGVGARNLKECLLIQISEYNFENPELEEILEEAVSNHLEDIAEANFNKVGKAMGIPASGVERLSEFIQENLNPDPGSSFGTEARHVIPSFAVEKGKGGYKLINLEKSYGPLLKISPHYMKMISDPKTDEKTLKFLKEKLESAKALMENISKRIETTEKIMEKIKTTQADFFAKGALFLKPLLQKDLASEFGVHPSTISRTIAEKFIQTPQGMFPIKLLCPRNYKGQTPGKIKGMIKEIIDEEDKAAPLSDDHIKKILSKEGTDVPRRTVAEYRTKMKIPSSNEREIK